MYDIQGLRDVELATAEEITPPLVSVIMSTAIACGINKNAGTMMPTLMASSQAPACAIDVLGDKQYD